MPDSSFESVAELVSKSDNQLLGQVVSSVREALLECSPEEADAHVVAFLLFVNEFMPEALDGIEPGVGSSLQKDTGWEGHIKDVLADNGHYYFGPISKHMYGIMGSGPGRMDVRGYGPRGKKNPKKSPTHSNAPAQADHGRGSGTRDTHEEITGIVRMLGARDGEIGGDTKAQYDALSEQDKQDLDDIEAAATKLGITLPTRREMKDMSHEDLVILMDKLGLLGETRGGTLNVVDSDVEGGEGFKRRARDVSDYAPKAERGAGKNLKQSNNSGVKSALDTYRKNKQRREDGTLDGKITDDDKRLGTISRHDTGTHDKPRPGMKHRVSATEQDDAAAAGIKPGKRGYGTKDQEGTADQQPDMTENKFKVQQAKQKLKNKAKLAETERAHIADLTSGKADIPAAQAEDLTGTKVPEKAAAGPAPTATPDAKQKLKDNLKRADVPAPEDTTSGADPVDAKQKLKDNLKRADVPAPEEPAKPELSPSQQKLLDYIETLPDGHPRKRLFLKALNEPSKLTKAEKSMISKIANKKDKADLEYGGYAGHQKLLTDEQRAASEAAMRARMQFTGYGKDDLTPENFVGGYDPAVHGERAKPEAKVSPEKLAIPNVIEAKGKKFVPYGTTDEKSTPDFGEQQPATSPSDLFAKLPGLNAKSNYSFAGISGELLYDEPDHKGLSEPTRDILDGLIANKESSKDVKDAAAQLLAIDDSNKAGQTPEWLSSLAEADKMAWKLDGTPDGGELNGAITELLNEGMSPATRRAVESISGGSNEPGAERAASLILQSADLMSKVPGASAPKVETPKTSGSIPDFSDIELTPTGKQGGSTGAKFAKDKDGNTWIIKDGSNGFGADPKDRVASELAANAIYRALGANVPEMGTHNGSLAYRLIDGKPVVVDDKNAELSEHFLVDALLANYDFLGTGGADERNIIQGSDGKMYRIDHGGVFDFRAQGGKKEYGNDPLEHIRSMLDSSKGGQGAKILDASEADLQAQAKKISSTMDGPAIAAIFDGLEWSSPEHGKKIRKAFVDRLVFMDELGDGMDVLPADVKSKLKPSGKPEDKAEGSADAKDKVEQAKKYALDAVELMPNVPAKAVLKDMLENPDEFKAAGSRNKVLDWAGADDYNDAPATVKIAEAARSVLDFFEEHDKADGTNPGGPNATPDFASIPDVYLPDAPTTEELKEQAAASGKGLSTGMIVVDKKTGKLWIYEPLNGYGGYDFTFPKGQQEDGLTAQQNAHKELFEETGLRAEVTGYLGGYDKSTSLSAYFIAEKAEGDPIESGPETASVREVTFEEAKKLLNTSVDKKILDELEQKLGSGDSEDKPASEDTDPLGGVALEATPGTAYSITYKDGTTGFTSISTTASENAIKQVQNLLDDAAKKGAKVVTSPDNFSPKPKPKVLTTPDGKTADQIKQEIDANASLSSSDKKFMKKDLEEVLQGNMSAYTLENLTAHSEDDDEWGDNARQTFKDIIAIGLAAKGEAQPKNDSISVTASEAPKLLKPGTKKSLLQQKSKAAAAIDKALAITTNTGVKFKLEELRAGLNDPGSFNPASLNELAVHSGTRVNTAAAEVTKLLNEWNAAGQPNLKPKSKEQRDLEAKEAAKLGEKTNTGAFVQQLKDKPLEAKLEVLDDLSRQIGEGAEDAKILRAHQASLKQHLIATTDLNKSELDSRVKSVTSKAKRDKETAPEREARAAEKAELAKLSKQELIEKAIDSHRELGQFLLDIAPSLKNTPGTVNDEYAKEYERLDRQKGILAEVLKEQHGLTASQLGGLRAKGKKQVVGEPDTSFIQLTPEQLLSAAQGDKAKMILDKAHVQVPPEVISAIDSHQGGTTTQREVLTDRLNYWKSQGKLDRGLSAYELMAPEYAAPGEGTWEQRSLDGTRAIWREADKQNGISEAILNIRHGESKYGVGGYTLEELQGMIGSDMVMQEVLNGSLLPSGSSMFRYRDVHIIQYCPPGDKVLGFTAAHKANKPDKGDDADLFAKPEAELYPAIGAVNRIAAVEKNSKDSPYYDPLYKDDDWLVVLQRHSSAFGGADAEKVMREDRKRRRAQENAKLKVLSDKLNGED